MASSINWPPSLPQYPLRSRYVEKHGVLVSSTPMDAGPAKLRRRGSKPVILTLEYLMKSDQLDTLDTFVKQTLMGVKRFNLPYPRTLESVEVRIVPSGDGEFFSATTTGPNWFVALSVEILP